VLNWLPVDRSRKPSYQRKTESLAYNLPDVTKTCRRLSGAESSGVTSQNLIYLAATGQNGFEDQSARGITSDTRAQRLNIARMSWCGVILKKLTTYNKSEILGCFSRDSIGPLHRVQGIMDRFQYRDILQQQMLPHSQQKLAQNWIFQHDNDPKHTSKLVKEWFSENGIRVLKWPAQSPDLNPIEHLWDELERRLGDRKFTRPDDFFAALQEEWSRIPMDVFMKLVDSMPRRCEAVIRAKGFPTKY
jgi:hypothetical protein